MSAKTSVQRQWGEDYPKQDPISRRHRGQTGWCSSDVWSMDTYISGIMAGMLRHLQAGLSYPSNLTEGQWKDILEEMADGFDVWAKHFELGSTEAEEEAYRKVRKSIRLLHRWFGNLWD